MQPERDAHASAPTEQSAEQVGTHGAPGSGANPQQTAVREHDLRTAQHLIDGVVRARSSTGSAPRDPAPEALVLGQTSQAQLLGSQACFELGAAHARAHVRDARGFVDGMQAAHEAQVDRQVGVAGLRSWRA